MADYTENLAPDDEDATMARPKAKRGGRGIFVATLVLLAGGVFAGVLYYTYNKGKEVGTSGIPPIIRAAEGPTRIRPDAPGGMAVPDRDKEVFSRIDPSQEQPKTERLLPPPETAMSLPKAVAEPSPVPPPVEVPPSAAAVPPPSTQAEKIPAPENLAREIKRPEKSVVPGNDEAPSAPVMTPPPRPAAKETSPPPAAAKAVAEAQSAAPAAGAAIKDDDTLVQLGALRSEASARERWDEVKAKHRDLFGTLALHVEKADLGAGKGIFYRIQAGPLASLGAARDLCAAAKKRGVGCFVVSR